MPLVVGLTGGIGSGKSAAADEFGRLGATVVDTDAIAHELTAPGGAAVAGIAKLFGKEPKVQARHDLRRFKQLMETGEVSTSKAPDAAPRGSNRSHI